MIKKLLMIPPIIFSIITLANAQTIKVSIDQLMANGVSDVFNELEKGKDINDQPNYVCLSKNNLMIIQFTGDKDDLLEVNLVIAIGNGDYLGPNIMTGLMLFHNSDPEFWSSHPNYTKLILDSLAKQENVEIEYGTNIAEVTLYEQDGIILINFRIVNRFIKAIPEIQIPEEIKNQYKNL